MNIVKKITSCLSKVSGNSSRRSGSSKSSRQTVFTGTGDDNKEKQTKPEVGKLSENVIYIKTVDGQYATFTVNKNTTDKQLINWGKKFGVDLKPYMK